MKNKKEALPLDVSALTLREWLDYLDMPEKKRPMDFAGYCFPSDNHFHEYLDTIKCRTDSEIRNLLRNFLLMGGSLGVDKQLLRGYLAQGNFSQLFEEREFVRRLIHNKRHTWEGMSWMLDLLPDFPTQAIAAIEAYDLAHYFLLPDGRVSGLADAVAIIRAKYLDAATEEDILESVSHRDFEFLIAALYSYHDYEVAVTQPSRDGGYDVVAVKDAPGMMERILVECKCQRSSVKVGAGRALVGVLDAFGATRGVLVSTSNFTKPAIAYAKKTARLELVDRRELCRRLNASFGPSWLRRVSEILRSVRVKLKQE